MQHSHSKTQKSLNTQTSIGSGGSAAAAGKTHVSIQGSAQGLKRSTISQVSKGLNPLDPLTADNVCLIECLL